MEYEDPNQARALTEIWERRKIGIDLRQKYEFYFVSLIFTLAAASVQSATKTCPRWRLVVEVAGWVLLIIAGMIGLWRIGKLWIHQMAYAQARTRSNDSGLSEVNDLDSLIHRAGAWQNSAFLIGFFAVVASRAALLLS